MIVLLLGGSLSKTDPINLLLSIYNIVLNKVLAKKLNLNFEFHELLKSGKKWHTNFVCSN